MRDFEVRLRERLYYGYNIVALGDLLIVIELPLGQRNCCAVCNLHSRSLGHICIHTGSTAQGQHPEDGEIISQRTLPYTPRIRTSSPGGLRQSTLPVGRRGSSDNETLRVTGKKRFIFYFKQFQSDGLTREHPTCFIVEILFEKQLCVAPQGSITITIID